VERKNQKMTIKSLTIATLTACFMFSIYATAQAENTAKIEWENLMPKATIPPDPVIQLPTDLQVAFENLQYWLSLTPQGKLKADPQDMRDLKKVSEEARALFKSKGVSFNKVYQQFNARQKTIDQINRTTLSKYNSKRISIAGYLLPLEFDKRGVNEFLLVPYVGACIHVPPPPVNQTIFVRLRKRYKFKDLYDPVWVSGRINNTPSQKELSLVDGKGKIDSGYSLTGDKVTPYTSPTQ